MTEKDILDLIDKKIGEHKTEVFGSQAMSDKLKMELSATKEKLKRPSADSISNVMKLGVLKDKMIFHKACMDVLQDLRDEITGAQNDQVDSPTAD